MPSRKFLLQSANSSFWLPHLGRIVLVNEIGFKGKLNSKMVPYKNNLTLQNNAPILQNELLGSNLMVKFYVWSTCLICFLNLYHAHMKDYLFAFCQTLLLRSFLLFCFHSNQSEEIICKKVKVAYMQLSDFIHLWAVDWRFLPCTILQPSWTGGDISMKVKVLSLIVIFVDFSLDFCQCLRRAWGRKY